MKKKNKMINKMFDRLPLALNAYFMKILISRVKVHEKNYYAKYTKVYIIH